MARLGLGPEWKCVFANEWSAKKAATYTRRFGDGELKVKDVAEITLDELPGQPTLVWASFPCQDLSLAGAGAGLNGKRSGTFHPFWRLVEGLQEQGRGPRMIVLENVVGALTSHQGNDFHVLSDALGRAGYRFGALVIDAVKFVPQSRPRLFVIGVDESVNIPPGLLSAEGVSPWITKSLHAAYGRLPQALQDRWVWWKLPVPTAPVQSLSDLIECSISAHKWHSDVETRRLLDMMSEVNLAKVDQARRMRKQVVGTIYKRIRPYDGTGAKVQRAEVRFDNVSGCLRTPVGGSSRQIILLVEGEQIRSRLLSPREAARLMGAPDDYELPERYNDAYHLMGDGLVVPVVQWLDRHLLSILAGCVEVGVAA